jgi:hypothetical protein
MSGGTQSALPTGVGRRVTLAPSTTVAATAQTNQLIAAVAGFWRYSRALVLLSVTAAGTEAGDLLDVLIDVSIDGGATWINAAHFPQALGTGGAKKFWAVLNGNAPSAAPSDITADAAAGTVRAGVWGDQLRVRWSTTDAITTGNLAFIFNVIAWVQ